MHYPKRLQARVPALRDTSQGTSTIVAVNRNRLSSVSNAARAVKSFTSHHPTWGISELADHLDLSTSSTHRILATLADEGLLDQDPASGRYRLGLTVFDLAAAAPTERSLHEAALTSMFELRSRTGETVQLGVLDGREVVYVERLNSLHTLSVFREFGRRNAAHCSSVGKSLLAFSPKDQREAILDGWALPKVTEHTVTDMAEFERELKSIRRRGYSENRQESELGVVSIAAPILDAFDVPIAALSLVGPLERMDPHRARYAEVVTFLAQAISNQLRS